MHTHGHKGIQYQLWASTAPPHGHTLSFQPPRPFGVSVHAKVMWSSGCCHNASNGCTACCGPLRLSSVWPEGPAADVTEDWERCTLRVCPTAWPADPEQHSQHAMPQSACHDTVARR
eukprot:1137465-Pelagomonas_calceolata.AAC.11